MSKGSKILLGICTFLPLISGLALVFYYLSLAPGMMQVINASENPESMMPAFFSKLFSPQIILLIVLTAGTKIGLMIYYLVHVTSHPSKTQGEKITWILLFVLVGTIPYIVYFFLKLAMDKKSVVPAAG